MKSGSTQSWFKSNMWNIFVALFTMIVTYVASTTAIKARVQALEKENETQNTDIKELQTAIKNLPDKEYMDLKLQPMINDVATIKTDLKEHLQESR
jgi:cell division protein FtsB